MSSTAPTSTLSLAVRAAHSSSSLAYYYARKARETPEQLAERNARQLARYHARKEQQGLGQSRRPWTRRGAEPRPMTYDPGLTKAVEFQPPPALTAEAAARLRKEWASELRCRELERDQLDNHINRLTQQLAALPPAA